MILINGNKLEVEHFPDGTQKLGIPEYWIDYEITTAQWITWNYENDSELFTLYCVVEHMRKYCAKACIKLSLPYVPNARMDRTHNDYEVFTLKYFASFINSMNFDEVAIFDPHSNVSPALFDRCVVTNPYYHCYKAGEACKPDVIFYPDEGAMKRYSSMLSIQKPITFGMKKRDWATGKIEGLDVFGDVEALKDAKVLIIDDICSRGGTFYHSALKLKELGAKEIYLYVSHCEDTIHEGELLKDNGLIEKVYTTDSIINRRESEKIEVIKR